jgi:hypothetical protein
MLKMYPEPINLIINQLVVEKNNTEYIVKYLRFKGYFRFHTLTSANNINNIIGNRKPHIRYELNLVRVTCFVITQVRISGERGNPGAVGSQTIWRQGTSNIACQQCDHRLAYRNVTQIALHNLPSQGTQWRKKKSLNVIVWWKGIGDSNTQRITWPF